MKSTYKKEMEQQALAFGAMHGDILDEIATYAEEFRAIINAFEAEFNRVPSADDLL